MRMAAVVLPSADAPAAPGQSLVEDLTRRGNTGISVNRYLVVIAVITYTRAPLPV